MAPRRGGGGGRISIGGSTDCPDPFSDDNLYAIPVAYFVSFCIFFVVAFITLIAMFKVRQAHHHAKRILGGIYGIALLFFTLGYTLLIIATLLRNCGTTEPLTYNDWALTTDILFRLATFMMLVLVFWAVNLELSKVAGKGTVINIISAVVLGIMFCLTAGYIGVSSYNDWAGTVEGEEADAEFILGPWYRLSVAYWTLYLVCVIGATVLQIVNIASIRSRGVQTGNLSAWVAFTMFSMFIWTLFYLIDAGAALAENFLGLATEEAIVYVADFFQATSFIGLLGIAKSTVFSNPATPVAAPQMYNNPGYPQQYTPVPQQYAPAPQQYAPAPQQYAPAPQQYAPVPQQYYYQQQPVYNNVPAPMNGQGQFVQAK